ncbi:phytoene/squalene synthase family protein [Gordonia insulae]|uniref:All-trans-phytoene synthase n=1 Tax=Gordonia insulae TaxID=2420509 RepID=A0A3G8JEV9_9ACTN|nr:phytoene/squalene synthase family protein [Gordonia insulae]AZG43686.1 All-trans-phytoene synthase [Gordonia insulae]
MDARDATDPELIRHGYRRARALTAAHGRTYYAAACLLPPARRRGVFALYGFARVVDDLVDLPPAGSTGTDAAAGIDRIESALHRTVTVHGRTGDPGHPGHPDDDIGAILAALGDTVARFDIPTATFDAFLRSMRMDVPGTAEFRDRYRSWAELAEYTYGSASVIGVQMLPLLGVDAPGPAITAGAARLGEAFQLTNFVRDVAEDLDRGRIYLPTDELAAFGVDEDHLRWCRAHRTTSGPLRRALAHIIAVNRDQYRQAWPAITMLPSRSRRSIHAAATTYRDILTEIERVDYRVMDHRAVVGTPRRAMRAAQAVVRHRSD